MYDITNGKLLRSINDATTPGTCVLHVKVGDFVWYLVCYLVYLNVLNIAGEIDLFYQLAV